MKKITDKYSLRAILYDIVNEMYCCGHFMSKDRAEELLDKIDKLPHPNQKQPPACVDEVIRLRREGLTFKQIAQALGWGSPNTAFYYYKKWEDCYKSIEFKNDA